MKELLKQIYVSPILYLRTLYLYHLIIYMPLHALNEDVSSSNDLVGTD